MGGPTRSVREGAGRSDVWRLARSQAANGPRMPTGCRTLTLEVFCGAVVLTSMFVAAGYPVSQPADELLGNVDLMSESEAGRREIDKQIKMDNPFLIAFAFPCGPWNPFTRLNVARYPRVKEFYEKRCDDCQPMLDWIARATEERVKKARAGWRSWRTAGLATAWSSRRSSVSTTSSMARPANPSSLYEAINAR